MDMSLLKAWWGGSTQEGEGKKDSEAGESVSGEEKPETNPEGATNQEVVTNPWVKGFGGELFFSFSAAGYVVIVNILRYGVQC